MQLLQTLEGTNLTVVVGGTHQFIMYNLSIVQPVRRGGGGVRQGGGEGEGQEDMGFFRYIFDEVFF